MIRADAIEIEELPPQANSQSEAATLMWKEKWEDSVPMVPFVTLDI